MDNKDNSSQSNQQLDENILNYIKRELKRGVPIGSIRETLLKVGHHPLKVDLHFRYLEREIKKKPNILFYLLIFFVVFSIFSSALNIFLYKKITVSQRYEDITFQAKDLCTKGEYEKGLKKLEKAMKLNNKRGFAFAIYGHCYLLQGKYVEAVEMLTEAVSRVATESLYFYRLGTAHCSLKNYNFGVANLRKALDLNPTNPDYISAIEECYSGKLNETYAANYKSGKI